MGGRAAIVEALAFIADTDETAAKVLAAFRTDRHTPLALVCARLNPPITITDLVKYYRQGRALAMAVVKARTASDPEALVGTLTDVLHRARPHEIPCPVCHGHPKRGASDKCVQPPPCHRCGGRGVVMAQPSLDRQKYALDLMGVGPVQAPTVAVTNDNRSVTLGAASPDALARLLQATDRLLTGTTARSALPVASIDAD